MTSGARLSAACSMLSQQSQKLESLSWAGANNSSKAQDSSFIMGCLCGVPWTCPSNCHPSLAPEFVSERTLMSHLYAHQSRQRLPPLMAEVV